MANFTDEAGTALTDEAAVTLLTEDNPGAGIAGVAASVLAAGGLGSAISNGLVQAAGPVLNAGSISFPNPITPGNTVIVAMSRPTGITPPITIAGNGQVLSLAGISTGGYTWIYYLSGVGAGAGNTITAAAGSAALWGYEVAGACALDKVATASTAAGSPATSFTVSTAATLYRAEFWVAVVYGLSSPSSVAGPGAPWVEEATEGNAAASGYKISSATGVATYTGTFGSASTYEACIATFALAPPIGTAIPGSPAAVGAAGGAGTSVSVAHIPGSPSLIGAQGGTGVIQGGFSFFPAKPLGIEVSLLINGIWVNITNYVYQRSPISITGIGRADEQGGIQAGQMSITLDNRDGRFVPVNTSGPYYPYLGLNTQMRVRVNDSSANRTLYSGFRFWGEVPEWPVTWDLTGTDVYSQVVVSGIWRRLAQSTTKIGSPFKRYHLNSITGLPAFGQTPQAYWPMEDASASKYFINAIPGPGTNGNLYSGIIDPAHVPVLGATLPNQPAMASNTSFSGSDPIPVLNKAAYKFPVPPGGSPVNNVVRFVLAIPPGGDSAPPTSNWNLIEADTTGTIATLNLYVNGNGTLGFVGTNSGGGTLFIINTAYVYQGFPVYVSMEIVPTTGGIFAQLGIVQPGDGTYQLYVRTDLISGHVGNVTNVWVSRFQALATTAMGHLSVSYGPPLNQVIAAGPLNGYDGEFAGSRFQRLCIEQNIPFDGIGLSTGPQTQMGPQVNNTISSLLQTIEDSDCGLLYELRDKFGIGYRTQLSMVAQAPALTVSYPAAQLSRSPAPTYDDQRIKNDIIVTNYDGFAVQALLAGGPRSVQDPPNGVGTGYQQTRTVCIGATPAFAGVNTGNPDDTAQVWQAALFLLGVGGVNELRYPDISFDLARTEVASLFSAIPSMRLGDFLQVLSPPAFLGGTPISQLVRGYSETLGPFGIWTITFNCVPETPWSAVGYTPGPVTLNAIASGTPIVAGNP